MPDNLLTVPEVATRLRASENTIRRWLRQGRLKGILPGGDRFGYRIAESEVDRFIREGGDAATLPESAGDS